MEESKFCPLRSAKSILVVNLTEDIDSSVPRSYSGNVTFRESAQFNPKCVIHLRTNNPVSLFVIGIKFREIREGIDTTIIPHTDFPRRSLSRVPEYEMNERFFTRNEPL